MLFSDVCPASAPCRLPSLGRDPRTGSGPVLRGQVSLYKAELVERKGPWRGLDDLEYATLEWVDWFNHRRLFSAIGYVPPAEYEANLYRGTVPAEAETQ